MGVTFSSCFCILRCALGTMLLNQHPEKKSVTVQPRKIKQSIGMGKKKCLIMAVTTTALNCPLGTGMLHLKRAIYHLILRMQSIWRKKILCLKRTFHPLSRSIHFWGREKPPLLRNPVQFIWRLLDIPQQKGILCLTGNTFEPASPRLSFQSAWFVCNEFMLCLMRVCST